MEPSRILMFVYKAHGDIRKLSGEENRDSLSRSQSDLRSIGVGADSALLLRGSMLGVVAAQGRRR